MPGGSNPSSQGTGGDNAGTSSAGGSSQPSAQPNPFGGMGGMGGLGGMDPAMMQQFMQM